MARKRGSRLPFAMARKGRSPLPVAMVATTRVLDYARRISENWQKWTDSIFEVARLCAEANQQLQPHEKRDLLESLPFSRATFSKLVKIGSDKRLQKPSIRKAL